MNILLIALFTAIQALVISCSAPVGAPEVELRSDPGIEFRDYASVALSHQLFSGTLDYCRVRSDCWLELSSISLAEVEHVEQRIRVALAGQDAALEIAPGLARSLIKANRDRRDSKIAAFASLVAVTHPNRNEIPLAEVAFSAVGSVGEYRVLELKFLGEYRAPMARYSYVVVLKGKDSSDLAIVGEPVPSLVTRTLNLGARVDSLDYLSSDMPSDVHSH
jgi:hypothetical protein